MGDARQPVAAGQRFPFDVEFQKALLRLMAEDDIFGVQAIIHLQATYFESEIMGWIFSCMKRFFEAHGAVPSMAVVMQETNKLDATIRQLYAAVVYEISQVSLRDEVWLRDATLEFGFAQSPLKESVEKRCECKVKTYDQRLSSCRGQGKPMIVNEMRRGNSHSCGQQNQ